MVQDAKTSNKMKSTKIPEKFIQQLETMTRESTSIESTLSQRLSSLQVRRFSFVPPTRPNDTPPTPVAKGTQKKKWDKGNCGANHIEGQIKWGK
jgi:hypothetical protein